MYVPMLLSAKLAPNRFPYASQPCPHSFGSFLACAIAESAPLNGYAPQSNTLAVAIRNFWPVVRGGSAFARSEEHTSELQSRLHLVCRLLLEKKKRTSERALVK